MNYTIINSRVDLEIILGSFSSGIGTIFKQLRESDTHMWALSLPIDSPTILTFKDLHEFLTMLVHNCKLQIPHGITPIIFYLWFDEQVGHLCFNIIDADKNALPFGCDVILVDTADDIFETFLNSKVREGMIPFDEIELLDNDLFNEDDIMDPYVLTVYAKDVSW